MSISGDEGLSLSEPSEFFRDNDFAIRQAVAADNQYLSRPSQLVVSCDLAPAIGRLEPLRSDQAWKARQCWWSQVDNDQKNQMRRRSMYGTALFVLGILALIAAVVTGSVWLGAAAVVILVPGAVMLYQVGKSLP
jgi:hypothetical protein